MLSDQMLEQVADPVLATRLQLSHARAKARGVELRLDGTLENARRDLSEDLADIVGILVDNAIDAAAEGPGKSGTAAEGPGKSGTAAEGPGKSGTAAERRRGGWVRLSLARGAGGGLDIRVRDNGRGIPEPCKQVFAPSWTTKGSGRGFGLALACDKVSRLHGDITAHNDGGAVFSVSIPVPREEEE
jgi:two-component system, CitB family, sensor kinase